MVSNRSFGKIARTVVLAAVWAVGIAGIVVSQLNNAVRETPPFGAGTVTNALGTLVVLSFPVVGSLIILRYPKHPVGWIFIVQFFFVGLDPIVEAFTLRYADRLPEVSAQFATTVSLIDAYRESVSVSVWFSLLIFPPLYFPSGQLPSPRLRRVVWVLVALLVVHALNFQLATTWLADEWNFLVPVLEAIGFVAEAPLLIASVLAPLSLVVRFRRARGVERQQIKWPLFSAMLATIGIGGLGLLYVLYRILGLTFQLGEPQDTDPLIRAGLFLEAASVVTFPITVAIGILRYRLYDIDLLINRTLVYGLLSGALSLLYFAAVTLFQGIFRGLTGQESPLAIVLSTLLIAALLTRLRRRIQDFIDRRFYRRKYDAAQTLARFAASARDEVDLDSLAAELLRVVEETIQPEHVSLWLKESERPAAAIDINPVQSPVT